MRGYKLRCVLGGRGLGALKAKLEWKRWIGRIGLCSQSCSSLHLSRCTLLELQRCRGKAGESVGTRGLSVIVLLSINLTLILMGLSLAAEAKVYSEQPVQLRHSAMQSPA